MKPITLPTAKIWPLVAMLFLCNYFVLGQTSYPRSPTPLSGHYPGSHTGLRCGSTPAQGIGAFTFIKVLNVGDLKDANGNTIAPTNNKTIASITGIGWNTKIKVLGMTLGGLMAVPINQHYNHPNDTTKISSNIGLGDIVIVPLGLYGTSKNFDYQLALGFWSGSGYFTPGGANNHGSGFSSMLYSVGGTYYLKGNRKSFNFSAVGRFETAFNQRETEIQPGADVVVDYGLSSPFLPLDKDHKHVIYFGICGFYTTQLTEESGVNDALNTSKYKNFATGGEIDYMIPSWKVKMMFRTTWEYGARNTTQGINYWFSLGYHFGK